MVENIFSCPWLHYNKGDAVDKKRSIYKILLIGLFTGLCNGLFGSGGGTIVVPAMKKWLGVEAHDAHATAIAVILPLTLVSTVIYLQNGLFDHALTFKVAAGGMVGGYLGARLLKKLPTNILRRMFALFMMAAAIRMIL